MATRTIDTKIVLAGEKEFNAAMKGVNNNLKNLRTDMAVLSETFSDNANSMEALTSKQKTLQASVDQHRAKVDALSRMYERTKEVSGENSAAADKYRQQLNAATAALIKEERALKQNGEALEKTKAEAAAAEQAVEKLTDANEDAAKSARKAGEGMEDMAKKTEKADSVLPKVAQGLGSVAAGAVKAGAAVVALGAGMGVAGLTAMVSFAKEAAEAARAASEAGEVLSESQQKWLDYAERLGELDTAATRAKSALGGVLLPTLNRLSTDSATYLNSFARSMEAAGGSTEKQSAVISEYISAGATLIMSSLPEYVNVGKGLLGGIKDGFMEVYPELADSGVDLIFDFLECMISNAPEAGRVGLELFDKLLSGLESRGPELALSAGTLIGDFVVGLIENAPALIPVAGTILLAFAEGLIESIPELADAAGDMIVSLGDYLTNPGNLAAIGAKALSIGQKIAQSIWGGLVELWNDLSSGFPNLINALGMAGTATMLGSSSFGTTGFGIPGHASGLDYVPFDNYLARLHKGEAVLTAAEAAEYRRAARKNIVTKIVNLTVNAKTITEAETNMLVDIINRKLGDDL